MKIVILYATREGQTRKIAEHLGGALGARGVTADVVDIAKVADEALTLDRYAAAILAAPVHYGKHKEMTPFVRRHRAALESLPCAFLSVSGSQASAENPAVPAPARARAAASAQQAIEGFFRDTGWRPAHVLAVAGAMLYTQYSFFIRLMIRLIQRSSGIPVDATVDHEYTDWAALDRFADAFVVSLRAPPPVEGTPTAAPDASRGIGP